MGEVLELEDARASRRREAGRRDRFVISAAIALEVRDGALRILGEVYDPSVDAWHPMAWEASAAEFESLARAGLAGHRAAKKLAEQLEGDEQPRAKKKRQRRR